MVTAILVFLGLITTLANAQDKPEETGNLPEDIYLMPFSHYDLAWTGTTPECLSRSYRIVTEAVRQAQVNPQYRWFVDNMFFLQHYISSRPEYLETIKELVKKGQIELNPLWIINFQDDNDGELYVRNLLYTKKYIKDTFGIEQEFVSLTDLPEWTPQFPQILARSGIKFAVMTRHGPENNHLIWWRAPDGTKLLTYHIGYGGLMYEPIIEISRRPQQVKQYIEKSLTRFTKVCKSRHALGYCGTDRSLPIPDLDKNVAKWNEMSQVKMKISTLKEFYEAIKDTPDLPAYSDEVPNAWMGIEAGFAKTFQFDQKALNLLETAEKFATISHILGYTTYPGKEIEHTWKGLIEAHDHGYGGHGYEEGDQRKIDQRQKAIYTAEEIIENSLIPIAEHIKTDDVDCIPIVVFNPLSWERSEVVNAHFTLQINQSQAGYEDNGFDWKGHKFETYPVKIKDKIVLKDDNGKIIPFQVIRKHKVLEYYIAFRAENVPVFGYKTYYIYPSKQESKEKAVFRADKNSLENDCLKLTVNQDGSFSLYDKSTGQTVVDGMRLSIINDLTPIRDGKQPENLKEIPLSLKQIVPEEIGPVRASVRLIYNLNHSSLRHLELKLSLSRGASKLDIESIIDYEMEKRREVLGISLVFPFNIKASGIHYGVPYGYNKSDNLLAESAIFTGKKNPNEPGIPDHLWKRCRLVQKWLNIKGKDAGFTIATSRQFFILGEKEVRCELLHINAKAFYLCPGIQQGTVISKFSIIPHFRTWQEDKAYRYGWELNNPLIAYSVNDTVSPKTLPKAFSFLESPSAQTIVTVLKKEEKGEGVILRLYEAEGTEGKIRLKFFKPITAAYECNLIEQPGQEINLVEENIKANEIKTIRLVR